MSATMFATLRGMHDVLCTECQAVNVQSCSLWVVLKGTYKAGRVKGFEEARHRAKIRDAEFLEDLRAMAKEEP